MTFDKTKSYKGRNYPKEGSLKGGISPQSSSTNFYNQSQGVYSASLLTPATSSHSTLAGHGINSTNLSP